MHTHHFIFLCTHYPIHNSHTCIHTHPYAYTPICIHTHTHTHPYAYAQLPYAYTQFVYSCIHSTTICIHMYTHMHTHHTICTHIYSKPTESPTVIRCAMRPAACWQVLLYSVTPFSLFLYLGLNKENVCPPKKVCVCVCVCVCVLCVCMCMCDCV